MDAKKIAAIDEAYLKNIFGWNLKYRMHELNLSQQAFAERVGVSQPNVARWATGHTIPQLVTLVKICAALDVTPGYLLKDRWQD